MGVERTIYLGPYFEVRSPKEIEKIDRCENPEKCPSPGSENRCGEDAFCSVCGVELKSRISEHRKRPDFIELLGNQGLMQCLSNTGSSPLEEEYEPSDSEFFVDCLVPNIANDVFKRGSFWLRDDAQDMTEVMHGNETQWMRKEYKKELETLIDAFGAESVRTRWGFISYWY